MKFEIHHLLGIDSAEVQVAPGEIVEVVGPNASGKTSFAVVVQALAGRNANPLGLSIGDARKTYLHRGDEDGFGQLSFTFTGEGLAAYRSVIEWLPRNGTMTGPMSGEWAGPISRPEAVGLVDFVGRQSDKARAAMLQPVLLPPPEEVIDALRDLLKGNLPEQDLLGVLKSVQDRGWDKTEAVFADRARIAKRSWCDITGRNRYGVAVAADWLPDGWLADYDGKTVLEAEGDVAAARDALALLHKAQAVAEVKEEIISEQQQQEAEKAKAALPDLRVKVSEAKELLREQQAFVAEARTLESAQQGHIQATAVELRQVKLRAAPQTSPCPSCDTPLMVRGGEIVSCDLTAFEKDDEDRAIKRAALEEKSRIATDRLEEYYVKRQRYAKKPERLADIEYQTLKRSLDDLNLKAEVSGEVIDLAERMRRDETKRLREEENNRALAEAEQESRTGKLWSRSWRMLPKLAICTIRSRATR